MIPGSFLAKTFAIDVARIYDWGPGFSVISRAVPNSVYYYSVEYE